MQGKVRIDVVLTEEGRGLLGVEPISNYLRDGEYFNCNAVEQNAYFLDMTVESKYGERLIPFKISIPLSFVLYMLSAEETAALGFKGHES